MRSLLILFLLGLVFSLHFSPSHEAGSDTDEKNKEWKEYKHKCEKHFLMKFKRGINCRGMKPEACKLAK